MRVVTILGALVVAASASYSFDEFTLREWETYKSKQNLKFESAMEHEFRLQVYVDNRIKIAEHNAKYARGEVGFTLGVNRFTHMTNEEVADTMNGYNRTARKTGVSRSLVPREKLTFIPPNVPVPDEVDWREKGAVTPVKSQGNCGSCYAFSATGALEGQRFLRTGKLVTLSEQNIIDCSREEGNDGCDGGWMDSSFQYVEDNNGTDTEEGYPYTAYASDCKYSNESKGVTDSGFVDIPEGDEEALKIAVATIGPISVAIDGSHTSFVLYHHGVYYSPKCSSKTLDHAVLVVGYGTSNDTDYWIVKNSWGPYWGEDGYVRMSRNKGNNCGIASKASYPIVD